MNQHQQSTVTGGIALMAPDQIYDAIFAYGATCESAKGTSPTVIQGKNTAICELSRLYDTHARMLGLLEEAERLVTGITGFTPDTRTAVGSWLDEIAEVIAQAKGQAL